MKAHVKSAAEWQLILAEKEDEIARLTRQVEWLTQQFRLMRSQQFGPSSETASSLRLSLFRDLTAVQEEAPAESEETETVTYRRRKQRGKRDADFSRFPTEQIVYELPESERICPDCGGPLHACGHEVLRRELASIPTQYKVKEHIQTVYGCRYCERSSDHVPMVKSEVPAALIPGSGIVSPSLLAQIINNKYVLALPLNRQEQEFERLDVPLSRQTMANWVIYTQQHWFNDLYALMRAELLGNEILHADETTLMVLREEGRKATQKSYVWVYTTSGDTERPVVLYDYKPGRAGVYASNFLAGFAGKLHTDGYEAYHCKLPPEITVVGCWSHMRRKFVDTLKSIPKEIRKKNPAQTGLNYCDRLFALEREYAKEGLSFEERHRVRMERSKPLADAFFTWAAAEFAKNPLPKSTFGRALTYAVNQEGWLMNVFLDGRLELSNNRCERRVRPFAIGRRNWLFCKTPAGADAGAVMYSVVETAKANGLKPFDYLHFLLTRLPQGVPAIDCLPWSADAQMECR